MTTYHKSYYSSGESDNESVIPNSNQGSTAPTSVYADSDDGRVPAKAQVHPHPHAEPMSAITSSIDHGPAGSIDQVIANSPTIDQGVSDHTSERAHNQQSSTLYWTIDRGLDTALRPRNYFFNTIHYGINSVDHQDEMKRLKQAYLDAGSNIYEKNNMESRHTTNKDGFLEKQIHNPLLEEFPNSSKNKNQSELATTTKPCNTNSTDTNDGRGSKPNCYFKQVSPSTLCDITKIQESFKDNFQAFENGALILNLQDDPNNSVLSSYNPFRSQPRKIIKRSGILVNPRRPLDLDQSRKTDADQGMIRQSNLDLYTERREKLIGYLDDLHQNASTYDLSSIDELSKKYDGCQIIAVSPETLKEYDYIEVPELGIDKLNNSVKSKTV